ncbi:protein mono-ADP-ribosyltransferase PARP14-like isoform X3 [Myxocyprinus asiaticus]|uniref:protein mono-ADP-ribosyltransferase PARP14-like isoform X3 n=1 Tax=Myxocyprinus asiaticus TaxID=70543 RepID=UPI002221E71C|nr:protein mono-ADP-ribosyltransferase PARP14-like isoform X3 [Myxocyprinus asiaticus]
MEEYPFPIIVEGDWRPEHAKSVKKKLQIYFQSKKKSQGGDCVVQYDEKSSTATIQFKSPHIRDGVLSKAEHVITIEKYEVKLKVSKPSDEEKQPDRKEKPTEQACGYEEPNQSAPQTELDVEDPQESSAVVLENVPDDAKKDFLALFVENVSKISEKDFSMELIPELNTAVVTFNNCSAAGKFLEKSRTHRNFQQYNLRAHALERSTCVRVEDLPADASKMLLELYFEKWGCPQEVITVPSEKAAIITFKEEKAKDNVLKKDHNICNVPVKIYPYFKSLGTALYGSNRPTWKLPEPITVSVHPAIREFLLKKGLISSIRDQMSSQFCQINMDKPEVLLSPDPSLLKQKGVTKRHIDGWSKNASDAFMKIISNYTAFEWPVLNTLWTKVESDIKEVVNDLVFIDMDASKGILTLAGVAHDVIGLKHIMEKMIERATTQMERERNSVTEDMDMSPAMYFLLVQDGMQGATTVSPQLNLDYKKDRNRLVLTGLKMEILTFKNGVLEKKLNMKQKHLRMDHSILEFLKSVDCDEMSRDLFISHGISAVYTVENGNILLFASTDRALADAEKKLGTVLTFNNLTVEDQGVLALPQWQDLNKTLQNSYNTSKKRTVLIHFSTQRDKVIVSGFREPVTEVSENIGHFIEKHSRIEDIVRVKSHAVVEFIKDRKSQDWKSFLKSDKVKVHFDSKRPCIKLSGERASVQPAMSFFVKMADTLHTDTLIIKKAGAKKYFKEQGRFMLLMILKEKRFVVVLQEDHMLEDKEDEFSEGSSEDFGQLFCEVQMPGSVTVTVRKADICKLNVDAVVNAANENLKHIGGVALALLQAAGPHLQQCCDLYIKVNGCLKPGDAIITDAGRLPCKYVVHAVGPRFSDSDRPTAVQRLRCAVRESLNQASGKNCSSIAVPTISSGIFGFPLELCTETIAKEVHDYIEHQNRSGSRNSLTEINLVDNNDITVKAMAHAVRKEFAAFSPKMSSPHHPSYKQHGNSNHGHGAQGYHGHGNHGHRNQDFGSHNHEPKYERGNKDFERQAYVRGETTDSFSGARSENFEGALVTKNTKEGLKITLSKGNIQDACADIIVNTVSEDLDLCKGAVSRSILQTAGHHLQSEVTRFAHSNNPHYGDTVITDGYNLKCSKVFHVICPFWNGGHRSEDEVLIQIIRDCLRKADTRGMASISFPAIGTGNLGFPKDLVAKIMLSEVQQFSPQNLREVTVIVHPSDKESIECFTSIFRHGIQGPITKGGSRHFLPKANSLVRPAQTSEERKSQHEGLIGKVSTPSLGVHTMNMGQVILEVSSGDITKEKTDAIVNSSNQTFSLKAGVSKAILDAAGLQVEQECLQIVSSSNVQQTEIVTSAGQLPCGNIIHIIGRNSPADIKEVVLSVLKLCEARQFTSVAFPALGTGQGGANPADVADAMVDAVVDFVKKKKVVHVKCVKFLIFQTSMVANFHQSMLRRSGERVEEEKSLLGKIKGFFFGESPENHTNEEFVMVSEEIEPVVFQLCGETPEDLRNAREIINSLIIKEHLNIPIRDPAIAHFNKEDVELLNAMRRELTVSFKLEKKGQDSVITLEGLTRDVHTAENRIRDMIRKVERKENRRREAFMVSSVVEWQYLEHGQNLKPFDMLTNYDLEEASQNRQPSVKIKIDNDEYDVNLVRRVATRGKMRIELKRVDLQVVQNTLPSHWEDMKGKSVVLVQLTASSQEYAVVEKEFKKTGLTIIKIERVQNSTLWKNYMIKKEELEDKNKHKNNEKLLFHGTGPNTTDQINHHGFNRSYAGLNGAMYGNGTYFAVDPSYSAQGYSKPDVNGVKRMYLARVLVGDFTQGKQGLAIPPAKSSNSVDLYNSVTDNPKNPSMFVIFSDVQAYPEYIITFK